MLLFIVVFLSCSSGDDIQSDFQNDNNNQTDDSSEQTPKSIIFVLEQHWSPTITFDAEIDFDKRNCSDPDYTIGIPKQYDSRRFFTQNVNHYGKDTLKIILSNDSRFEVDGFSFNLEHPSQNESPVHPKYIGHIELVNFSENNKIILQTNKLESIHNRTITYFTSNESDEFIQSILYNGTGNIDFCPIGNVNDVLVKSNQTLEDFKRVTIEVPYDTKNNNIEVGEIVSHTASTDFGEGWNTSQWNKHHKVISKEIKYN